MATEDTRDRLLAAAGEVFAEKGYDSATVRDICQRAEVNLAAVNYYFRDKERLYIEAVKCAHRLRIEDVPLPEWPAGIPASLKLQGFIQTMVKRILTDPEHTWHMKLMMREIMHPTQACVELVQDFIRPHFEMLNGILAEILPPDFPEQRRRLFGFSIIGQCLHFRVAQPIISLLVGPEEHANYTPEVLADHITRFSLAALGVKLPASKGAKS